MNALRLLLAASLFACATVSAQQPAQPAAQEAQLTEEQRAQLARQDAEMTQAALQVMQLVDANQLGEIWDGASAVMKQAVPKDDFIREISNDRRTLGAVSGRVDAAVTRHMGEEGGALPPGLYISVRTGTSFASQPQPVRELVSFRLDEDQVWRVSGYTLR